MSCRTVKDVINTSTDTGEVSGLSAQLIIKFNEIAKVQLNVTGILVDFSDLGSLEFRSGEPGHKVNPLLQLAAKKSLAKALQDHPDKNGIFINSAYRTVAQQHFLYQLSIENRGSGANQPGTSSHEDGLALDIKNYDEWQKVLVNYGWDRPFLIKEPWHFNFSVGTNSNKLKKIGVEAFQTLWNDNNPNDQIKVDGNFGPKTERRMNKLPANGF